MAVRLPAPLVGELVRAKLLGEPLPECQSFEVVGFRRLSEVVTIKVDGFFYSLTVTEL